MSTTPYAFIKRGNLFIIPVGPSIDEVPYPTQTLAKPPDYSLWVNGSIHEPGPDLDRARMSSRLYQEVRDDLTRYSPVEVTRSAIRRSSHAYVGVIDSRGVPYYFALDSRGVSVREAGPGDSAWKAFDRLAEDEHMAAVRQRRTDSAEEMRQADRELADPGLALVVTKGLKYGKKVEWKVGVPHSSWWRHGKMKQKKQPEAKVSSVDVGDAEKADVQRDYAAEYRRIGHELWLDLNDGESELDPPRPEDFDKALPKKNKEAKTKNTPSRKASKKQAGAGGKTRYTYPQEKKGGGARQQTPLVVVHDDTKHADPAELANQLGVSVRTLVHTARRLGSEGFSTFMRSRLKQFAAKHRLDPDYWDTLYAALIATPNGELAKSDHEAIWKQFGDDVKTVASAVAPDHHERFGDRKVFVHHVHNEMKRHGLYSGTLGEFKEHLVQAQRMRHLNLARADLVGAMDPESVKQSNIDNMGATFNFVSNVPHDPEAAKKLKVTNQPKSVRTKSKTAFSPQREAAQTLSKEAIVATTHAEKTRTPEAHLMAMTAHHHAGVAHQKATGKINHKAALAHFDRSAAHLKASKSGALQ